MNIIKPKKLERGDTIGILALSGNIEETESTFRAKNYFEQKGYNVVFSENVFDKNRYFAGTDEKKVQELHRFFQDKNIDAILCLRGGYGTIRLLNSIDFDIIKNNPKIFAGYSDVTAVQLMIYKKTGLITYSSPMFQRDFGAENVSEITEKAFFNALSENTLEFLPQKTYYSGEAKGILWGGNLSTLASLCGQDFIPDEKFIFFTEDLDEPVYKIDRMLTQLLNIEKFKKNLLGIVLGDFLNIDNEEYLDELFFEFGEKLKVPIFGGFKISHGYDKITVPIGANAKLTAEKLTIDVKRSRCQDAKKTQY